MRGLWLKNFISEVCLAESITRSLTIYCNNIVIVSLFENNKSSTYTNFDVKYQFVREKAHKHLTQIELVSSYYMLANLLTKGLAVGMFKRHVLGMGLVESFDVLD